MAGDSRHIPVKRFLLNRVAVKQIEGMILIPLLLTCRTPPIDYFTSALVKTGFSISSVCALTAETLIKQAVFMQKEGPLDKNWRNMDRWDMHIIT